MNVTAKQALYNEIDIINVALAKQYETSYAALATTADKAIQSAVRQQVLAFKQLKPTMLVLVGIGGSNLGTLAVLQALYGIDYAHATEISLLCADTIDNELNQSLCLKIDDELKNNGNVVLCIVTKSGTTTETLINAALFLEILKKRKDDYQKYVMIITDEQSSLERLALEQNFACLTVPPLVGGRYSVFSAVGLFPLALMGINIDQFTQGAQSVIPYCLNQDIKTNTVAEQAIAFYDLYNQGYIVHDIFVFSPSLLMLAHWYKQLIGESLAKKNTRDGKLAEIGITPTISVGTTDLHSTVQLHLAGPRNTVTSFLRYHHEGDNVHVPENCLSNLIPGLSSQPVTSIKEAIYKGVIEAYQEEQRPFTLTMLELSSFSIGQWMMMKMFETIFLARLFNINAFDQPAVELYKKRARHYLLK